MKLNKDYVKQAGDPKFAAAFARIECHYFVNGGFFERPRPAARRRREDPPHPGVIVQGRYDVVCPVTQRLGPAQGVARGRPRDRARRRALGVRAGHRARARAGHATASPQIKTRILENSRAGPSGSREIVRAAALKSQQLPSVKAASGNCVCSTRGPSVDIGLVEAEGELPKRLLIFLNGTPPSLPRPRHYCAMAYPFPRA